MKTYLKKITLMQQFLKEHFNMIFKGEHDSKIHEAIMSKETSDNILKFSKQTNKKLKYKVIIKKKYALHFINDYSLEFSEISK